MQENMTRAFLSRWGNQVAFPYLAVPNSGPAKLGEKPDYRALQANGIHTVNEIEVRKLALAGQGWVRPDLKIILEVQVRLISTADNAQIYCRVYSCSSKDGKFETWAAQEGKTFREEIDACYHDVADWSVTDLYANDTIIQMQNEPSAPKGRASRIIDGRRDTDVESISERQSITKCK